MYSREFLSRVDLDKLTDTYHIDGHLQFISGEPREQVRAIPIWKRYKNYEQLRGLNRLIYVYHVLRLSLVFRLQKSRHSGVSGNSPICHYSILRHQTESIGANDIS
jgi:hypothetical protein